MPLFYMLSGYCFNARKYRGQPRAFFSSRCRSLLLPYAVFVPLSAVYGIWKGRIVSPMQLLDCICNGTMSAIWFLVSLLLVEIAVWIITQFTLNPLVPAAISCITFILSVFLAGRGVRLWFSLNHSMMGLFYFCVGLLLRRFSLSAGRWPRLAAALPLLAAGSLAAMTNAQVVFSGMQLGNAWQGLFAALSICLGLFLLFSCASRPLLSYFGRNTIIILCLHQYMLSAIEKTLIRLLGASAATNLLAFVLCLLALVPTIAICNRYFYVLFGRRRPADQASA